MDRPTQTERLLFMLEHSGGALRVPDLRLARTSRRALEDLVANGQVLRRGPVVYLPDTSESLIACREVGAALTCGAAAVAYGLPWVGPDPEVHLAVSCRRGRVVAPSGCVIHVEQGLVGVPAVDPPLADPATLAARLLRCAPHKQAIVVVDAILNRGLATRGQIAERLRNNRHGCAEGRRRLARCSERARSLIESIARVELEDAGHHMDDGVVVVGVGEIDGYQFHSTRAAWANDRRRDQMLLARGLPTVRLTYDDVMGGRTVALVEAALRGVTVTQA